MLLRNLRLSLLLLLMLGSIGVSRSEIVPLGYQLPEEMIAPNGRYGVLVPVRGKFQEGTARNRIMNIRTDEILGTIRGETGWNSMKYGRTRYPRWSRDSSLLLWEVDGRWGPTTLMLVKIENDRIKWQVDLFKVGEAAILEATKKAQPTPTPPQEPDPFAFPEEPPTYTVDVYAVGNEGDLLNLPLKVHVDLTSNAQNPSNAMIRTQLNGTIDENGKFKVDSFQPTPAKTLRNW